ncbi:hypothetical protein HMPREF3156_01315 [Neisseria sp. HMSC06F02]|nr:hypothetical protein HMPREF3156_01315 [Neisseria sp. HMSC06F02]
MSGLVGNCDNRIPFIYKGRLKFPYCPKSDKIRFYYYDNF